MIDSGRKRKSRLSEPVECSKSLPSELQYEPNVQELFSFIESVLSSWFVEDGAYTSQGESENDDKSKSFEEEEEAADEADKKDADGEDAFQIAIEKQKKDRRKQRKGDDKEFKEMSFELNYWYEELFAFGTFEE